MSPVFPNKASQIAGAACAKVWEPTVPPRRARGWDLCTLTAVVSRTVQGRIATAAV